MLFVKQYFSYKLFPIINHFAINHNSKMKFRELAFSWRMSLVYRNHFIGLLYKSTDWFLYNQWNGFFMIGTSVMKELKSVVDKGASFGSLLTGLSEALN